MSAPKESAAAVGLMSLFTKAPKDVSPPREVHPNPTPPPGRLPTPTVAPPVPVQRSTSTSVPTPAGLGVPGLIRTTSQTRGVSTSAPNGNVGDWRSFVAIEERTHVRSQIREAYRKNCPEYNTLLAVVSAIDEELLFSNATARIDYFKAGIEWDGRLTLKRKHLAGQVGALGAASAAAAAAATATPVTSPLLSTMPVAVPTTLIPSLTNNISSASMSSSTSGSVAGGKTSGTGKPRTGKGNRKRFSDTNSNPHSPNSSSSSSASFPPAGLVDDMSYSVPFKGLPSDNIQLAVGGEGNGVEAVETFSSQPPQMSPLLQSQLPEQSVESNALIDNQSDSKRRRLKTE